MNFKKDFVWGTGTAAYQIEGAAREDGRGPSVWDDFCKKEGMIKHQDTGDIACDHYHRFQEDIQLMKEIGIKAYKLSISWTRILPNGIGEVNEKGLLFYENLIEELLKNGIEPYVVLFHWDYPSALQKQGGWMEKESPKWFENYVDIVTKRLGNRVKKYITMNEPQCFIGMGYSMGIHAPGYQLPRKDILQITHHVLLAHGLAVKVIRKNAPEAEIGYAPTSNATIPVSCDEKDIEAARKAYFAVIPNSDNYMKGVTWLSDPVLLGKYPEDGLELFKEELPEITKEDLEIISQPIDFYCQNVYKGSYVKYAENEQGFEYVPYPVGYEKTSIGWPITPESLYWSSKFLEERYHKPIYITENGAACADVKFVDGKIHDTNRINYLYRHIREIGRAVEEGIDIRGYIMWSLMDNFEWSNGYNERFGLIYIDYPTQERIIKDSGYWYKEVIERNGENIK